MAILGRQPDKHVHFMACRIISSWKADSFCSRSSLCLLRAGRQGVVIVDAGGGTVDVSAYAQVRKGADVSYTEIAPAQCEW